MQTGTIPENLKIAVKEAGLAGSDLDDRAAFQQAFINQDKGRIYVRICNIRRELGWSECRFNTVLKQLREDAYIQLHAGDVATMSEEDIALSYTDDNNFFYVTVTWKGPKAAALTRAGNPAMQFLTPPEPDGYADHLGQFATEEERIAAWNRLKGPAKKFFTPPPGVGGEDSAQVDNQADVATVETPPADERGAPPESLTPHRGSPAASTGPGEASTAALERIAAALSGATPPPRKEEEPPATVASIQAHKPEADHLERIATAQERLAAAMERIATALERPYSGS